MQIFWQRIQHEKACSTRLWGCVAGEVIPVHVTQHTHGLTQCSIPVFEGLLTGTDNKHLSKLLYRTAEWHGFAKLRMHTQSSLKHLESLTRELGHLMRTFRNLTSWFKTKALSHEIEAQKRAQARAKPPKSSGCSGVAASSSVQQKKKLNLFTPKFHALGDYVQTIQKFGTTDSFSTQVVWNLSCQCILVYILTMHRVNWLTDLWKGCMGPQINTTRQSKLDSMWDELSMLSLLQIARE